MWVNETGLGGQIFQGGWANEIFEPPYSAVQAKTAQTMALIGQINNAIINTHTCADCAVLKLQADGKTMPVFFKV